MTNALWFCYIVGQPVRIIQLGAVIASFAEAWIEMELLERLYSRQ